MKHAHFAMAFIASCFWTGLCTAADIQSVRSYRAPDHTRLVFDLDQPVVHSLFSLDGPDRVVIDLNSTGMKAELGALDMTNTPLTGIRSATRDGNGLRIVLDLSHPVDPRSFSLPENEQYGHRLVVDLYDKGAPPATARAPQSSQARVTASAEDLREARRDIVIAISAGHGGDDPGAIGVDRIREKNVVLAISRELQSILNNTPGYKAVMTRDGDYYVGLRQRTRLAHEHNADFYIAVHADAFSNSSARGATVYALSQRGATSEQAKLLAEKENSADLIGGVGSVSLSDKDEMLASVLLDLSTTASITSSLEAGDRIIASMGRVTRMRRTNVEQAAFVELKNVDIPSLLVETGYITNTTDAHNLNSSSHQRKLASALAEGITGYFHNTPPRGTWVSWQKENAGTPQSYTVARGDNLSEIAERFNIRLADLKAANGIQGNTIFIGQTLSIPGAGVIASNQISFIEHTIRRGETLSGIANSYRVPLARIRENNALNSDTIRVGQVIKIPST